MSYSRGLSWFRFRISKQKAPVTAIKAAATDDDQGTVAAPDWLPEAGKTTSDPSYPGADAVIRAAAAEVLGSFFGADHFEFAVTSLSCAITLRPLSLVTSSLLSPGPTAWSTSLW